jgi:hypothetical protein
MTAIELKAQVFDLLREIESHQIEIQKLNQKKMELLQQLESIPNVGLRTPNIDVTGQ